MAVAIAQQSTRSSLKGSKARASIPMKAISGNVSLLGSCNLYAACGASPSQKQSFFPSCTGTRGVCRDRLGSLQLFLDSADVRMWEKYQHGTLIGFTTNPTILERDNVPCTLKSLRYLVQQAHTLGAQEIQIQAWGGSAAAMEAAALRILDLDPHFITIKLPCTAEGLSAASALLASNPRTKITVTGVYTAHQILLAQAVGADYAAPYLGRMADRRSSSHVADQLSYDWAIEHIAAMQAIVHKSRSSLRILVASIRSAEHMAKLAAQGCNTFTISPAVAEQLYTVPDTLTAAAEFEAAAARNGGVDPEQL